VKKQFNSRLDEALLKQFKGAANERDVNLEEALEQAVRVWLGTPRTTIEDKAAAWVVSEDGGPAEKGVRKLVRDILNDAL
jgi:hypothetical protein